MDHITAAATWVSKKLIGGYDYKENHYQTLLIYALQKRGFNVSSEENLEYSTMDGGNKIVFGFGRMDLKVTSPDGTTWIVELKAVDNLKYVRQYQNQIRRYLKHYTPKVDGILIVFNNRSCQPHIETFPSKTKTGFLHE